MIICDQFYRGPREIPVTLPIADPDNPDIPNPDLWELFDSWDFWDCWEGGLLIPD